MRTTIVTLTEIDCSACGIVYAVPKDWDDRHIESGGTWWCPNGHTQQYVKTEVQRLTEKLETERRSTLFWRDQNTRAERRVAAQKGQATKLRKRIANGVCPCCHRHFTNLERHIAAEHPGYAATEPEEICT